MPAIVAKEILGCIAERTNYVVPGGLLKGKLERILNL